MRITTQMLNNSMKDAGVQMERSTLLDYVNGKKKGSTLSQILGSQKRDSENAVKKSGYERAEAGAGGLLEALEKMESMEDPTEYADIITEFADSFNDTLKAMKTMTGTLDTFYNRKLKEAVSLNRDALNKVGITISSNGSLSVDKEKLAAANAEDLKELFGKNGTLSEKAIYIADKIGENARANLESISNQYNAKGNVYSSGKSKYDFLG